MKWKDIINYVGGIIILIVGVGGLICLVFWVYWSSLTDTEPAQHTAYTQHKSNGHCSFLARKCIVDEWSPKCLWFECIIDGRAEK